MPVLPELPGLAINTTTATELGSRFNGVDHDKAVGLEQQGHQPYLATLDDTPVAYGWSATREARIGELGVTLDLSGGNRYLWDFVTLPDWRGLGIYPRMLQWILRSEADASRFWIGHDRPNVASGSGIIKAGFQQVGSVYQLASGGIGFAPDGPDERSGAANALLGLPVIGDDQ